MRKLSHEEIVARQVQGLSKSKLPFCVVLNNIRSLNNVGSIFRTADGVGVEKVWLCGFTGYPPQSGITKASLGAEDHVAWEYKEDIISLIKDLKSKDYQIVLLEQMAKSVSHDQFIPKTPVCLVVGNEVTGVSEELVSLCDAALEIEMAGIKNSLNVAVAFGVAAYQIRSRLNSLRS
jgi:23S rRNA (guanosine2251-2'-O)-methyltransferase